MQPIQPDGWCGGQSETPDDPSGCENGNDEHDGRFHQLSHSRAETWNHPEYANGAKDEACSEYNQEIKHAAFRICMKPNVLRVYSPGSERLLLQLNCSSPSLQQFSHQ